MKTWLNVGEGAEYAGVSRDTIYTACERKELRHARISGRRSIRLKPEWIDAWLERARVEAFRTGMARRTPVSRDEHRKGGHRRWGFTRSARTRGVLAIDASTHGGAAFAASA